MPTSGMNLFMIGSNSYTMIQNVILYKEGWACHCTLNRTIVVMVFIQIG